MPTYAYRCADCEHEFEEYQSITADPLDTCPECEGHAERVISGGLGPVFKGSGFQRNSSGGSSQSCHGKSCGSCSSSCSH